MKKIYSNNRNIIVLLSIFVGGISFANTSNNEAEALKKIYDSINTAGQISALNKTTSAPNKQSELVLLLDQIYANNPYAYTVQSTRENLRFFEDNLTYLTILPKKYDLSIQVKIAYPNIKQEDEFSLSSVGGVGERNFKTKSSSVSGIVSLEYGLTNESSLGLALGGNDQDFSFTGNSQLTSNNGYVGVFGRTRFGNLKLMAGGGYQFSSLKVDRTVGNNLEGFTSNSKYSIGSYNGFLEGRYAIPFTKIFRLEPKVRGSYYGISQEAIEEGYLPNGLSIKVDEQKVNTIDIKAGFDFIFESSNEDGKVSNTISLEGIAVTGDREKNLSAYVLGANNTKGSLFDIRASQIPEFTGRVAYNLEIEQFGGMVYNFKTSIELGDNGYTNYNFLVGAGYKFATYTEIIPKQEVIPEPEPEPIVEPEPEPIPVVEVKRYLLNLNFATNKAILTSADKEKVEEVAREINERNNNVHIKVVGHTDSTGSAAYNLKLSDRRAKAAKEYLESLLKNNENGYKITVESYGMGEEEPIASNKTREGRAKNRRVEIRIFE